MAKPPISYGTAVKLAPSAAESSEGASGRSIQPIESTTTRVPAQIPQETPLARRRPMESRSDPTVLYLHPDGKYELKRYALARGPKVKVHDLIMEAVEEWAERHGIAAPFRVPSEKTRMP